MLLINDLAVIVPLKRLLAVLLLDLFLDLLYQTFLNRTVTVDIIRRDAGLAAVQVFAEDDPSGGKF